MNHDFLAPKYDKDDINKKITLINSIKPFVNISLVIMNIPYNKNTNPTIYIV